MKGMDIMLHGKKTFEQDNEVCQMIVDSLTLLANTSESRKLMKEQQVVSLIF